MEGIPKNMEWISVKDRLPDKGESVGYVFDGKNIRYDVYAHGFNGGWETDSKEAV